MNPIPAKKGPKVESTSGNRRSATRKPKARNAARAKVAEPPAYDEKTVDRYLKRKAAQEEAERRLRNTRSGWKPPDLGSECGLLSDLLDLNPKPEPKLIDGICGRDHNQLLGASYKAGKTTFEMNKMRSCVDGRPFLDRATHFTEGGRWFWINGEMSKADWDDYIRPMGIKNLSSIAVLHMRGRTLDLLNDFVAEWFVGWLTENEATDGTFDSLRRLLAWSKIALSDNDGAGLLSHRIDEIKSEAGLFTCGILAHTGRKEFEYGEEHIMGATEWDAWGDSRQILTKDGTGNRFFEVQGARGVDFPNQQVHFDPDTHLLQVEDGPVRNRKQVEEENIGIAAEAIVAEQPGIKSGELQEALGRKLNKSNHNEKVALVGRARASGLIHYHEHGNAKLHYLGKQCSECSTKRFVPLRT